MSTALFVHGISIRQRDYNRSFQQIEEHLKTLEPGMAVAPCVWGDAYGAALKAGGASIPHHSISKGSVSKGLEDTAIVDAEIGSWQTLYADPLAELRLWSLRPPVAAPFDPLGRKTAGQLLDERLQSLAASVELMQLLGRADVGDQEFHAARRTILTSPSYTDALNATPPDELNEFAWLVARAIVSRIVASEPSSADLRDELVERLSSELGNPTKGMVSNWLTRTASGIGTRYVTAWREFFASAVVPYVGDVLLYQSGGKPIRDMIRADIAKCQPPVVLLAHSLGGVACVELLAAEALPEVALLVTVGSQAPFFYEMDALTSLRFGEPLPDHFPRWLNIYDRADFLSFVGAPVFPGHKDLEDVEVNNRQPFPWSHTSYWSNHQTWDAIHARLPRELR